MDIKTRRLREATDTKNNTMARMTVAAAIAANRVLWRCPHCGEHLGVGVGDVCPRCGKWLDGRQ